MTGPRTSQFREPIGEVAEPAPSHGIAAFLTSGEVARILNVAPSTLCRWRATGQGPRVYWLGTASPRYRVDDILEWLERLGA